VGYSDGPTRRISRYFDPLLVSMPSKKRERKLFRNTRRRILYDNFQRRTTPATNVYTFIRHEDRIGLQQRLKQTDKQTAKQTLQLPQHHSNAHNIKKEKAQ